MRMHRQKDQAITVAQARAQFKMMLAMTQNLDGLTVDRLIRSYRLPAKEIEYELTIARQKRAAQ